MINEVIKKNGITFGAVLGVALALIVAIIYSVNLKLFLSLWVTALNLAVFLAITITLLIKTKKELKGIFSFKDAFTTYFIAILIAILISTFFNIFLFNVIDPGAKDTLGELVKNYVIATMKQFRTPTSKINETLANMKGHNPYATAEQLKSLVYSIVCYSILGLIMAAIFKNKAPHHK